MTVNLSLRPDLSADAARYAHPRLGAGIPRPARSRAARQLYAGERDVAGVLFLLQIPHGSQLLAIAGRWRSIQQQRSVTSSTKWLSALRARHIAPGAYYSVIFDNWAVESHPEWALVPATTLNGQNVQVLGPRYGTACLNHPEYRSYENAQITALLERYDFDALWIDMAFWTGCVHLRVLP